MLHVGSLHSTISGMQDIQVMVGWAHHGTLLFRYANMGDVMTSRMQGRAVVLIGCIISCKTSMNPTSTLSQLSPFLVRCNGNETDIADCEYATTTDCSHSEDVFIFCNGRWCTLGWGARAFAQRAEAGMLDS